MCHTKPLQTMPSVEELQKEAADIQKRYEECQKCEAKGILLRRSHDRIEFIHREDGSGYE